MNTLWQLIPPPEDKGIDYSDERSLETGPSCLTSGFNTLQGMQVDCAFGDPRGSGPTDTNCDLSLTAPPHVFVCELRVRRGYVECTGNFQ